MVTGIRFIVLCAMVFAGAWIFAGQRGKPPAPLTSSGVFWAVLSALCVYGILNGLVAGLIGAM